MEKIYLREVQQRKFWQTVLFVLLALLLVLLVVVDNPPKDVSPIRTEVSGKFGTSFVGIDGKTADISY